MLPVATPVIRAERISTQPFRDRAALLALHRDDLTLLGEPNHHVVVLVQRVVVVRGERGVVGLDQALVAAEP